MAPEPRRSPAALSGAGSFALGTCATLISPGSPGFAGEPERIAGFYRDNAGALLAADTLRMLSGVLLLGFAGFLLAVSRRAEGADGRVAATAFGGAIVGAALTIAGAAVDAMGALRAGARDAIAPDVATLLWDLGSALHGLAAPMAYAVMVLATSLLSLRTGLLARWHAALGATLGVALAIVPLSRLALVAFGFWVLLTSLLLYLAQPRRAPVRAAAA